MKKTLLWGGGDEECGQTKTVVKATTDEFQSYAKDELGKPRRLRARPNDDREFANRSFGMATKAKNATAGELISGYNTKEEQESDPTLGKTARPGFRNTVEDPTRTFGTPTIRTDVVKKKVKSVADTQNYGDEPDARGVIYPTRFSERGLFEDDFRQTLPKDDLYALVQDASIAITPDEFDVVYARAADKNQFNEVTMENFMGELTQLRISKSPILSGTM